MANPLYDALNGGRQATPPRQQPEQAAQPRYTMQQAMSELRANPAGMIRQAGFDVPEEAMNDPRAAAMHIIQTGQAKGPVLQRVQPLLNMLMGRR